jgi:hypothetical protein
MQRDFVFHTVLCEYVRGFLNFTLQFTFIFSCKAEAEFLDVIGTKVFSFPPYYSQTPLLTDVLTHSLIEESGL